MSSFLHNQTHNLRNVNSRQILYPVGWHSEMYKKNRASVSKNFPKPPTRQKKTLFCPPPPSIDLEKVVPIQQQFMEKIKNMNLCERLHHLSSLKEIHHFRGEHHYSQSVTLVENFIIRKILPYNQMGLHLFRNEVLSLLSLASYPNHFPTIIAFDPKNLLIYMTYAGEQINFRNIPSDWETQFTEISDILRKTKKNSNDMIARNTCVLNGNIYIIDFGLDNQWGRSLDEVLHEFYYRLRQLFFQHRKQSSSRLVGT